MVTVYQQISQQAHLLPEGKWWKALVHYIWKKLQLMYLRRPLKLRMMMKTKLRQKKVRILSMLKSGQWIAALYERYDKLNSGVLEWERGLQAVTNKVEEDVQSKVAALEWDVQASLADVCKEVEYWYECQKTGGNAEMSFWERMFKIRAEFWVLTWSSPWLLVWRRGMLSLKQSLKATSS